MLFFNIGRKESLNLTKSTSHPNNFFRFSFKSYINDKDGFSNSTTISISLLSVLSCLATEPNIPMRMRPYFKPECCLNLANLFLQSSNWSIAENLCFAKKVQTSNKQNVHVHFDKTERNNTVKSDKTERNERGHIYILIEENTRTRGHKLDFFCIRKLICVTDWLIRDWNRLIRVTDYINRD